MESVDLGPGNHANRQGGSGDCSDTGEDAKGLQSGQHSLTSVLQGAEQQQWGSKAQDGSKVGVIESDSGQPGGENQNPQSSQRGKQAGPQRSDGRDPARPIWRRGAVERDEARCGHSQAQAGEHSQHQKSTLHHAELPKSRLSQRAGDQERGGQGEESGGRAAGDVPGGGPGQPTAARTAGVSGLDGSPRGAADTANPDVWCGSRAHAVPTFRAPDTGDPGIGLLPMCSGPVPGSPLQVWDGRRWRTGLKAFKDGTACPGHARGAKKAFRWQGAGDGFRAACRRRRIPRRLDRCVRRSRNGR